SPEGIDHLGSLPVITGTLIRRQINRVNTDGLAAPCVDPAALMAAGTGGRIEGLNLWFNHLLDMVQEGLYLLRVATGEFISHDEPGDRVEVHAGHLHTKTG